MVSMWKYCSCFEFAPDRSTRSLYHCVYMLYKMDVSRHISSSVFYMVGSQIWNEHASSENVEEMVPRVVQQASIASSDRNFAL